MDHYKKRKKKEFEDLLYNNSYLYSGNTRIASIEDITNYDTKQIYCYIRGPKDTPFENGIFKVSIKISENYPYVPPTIKFITPIYHPNLYRKQHYHLISESEWSPALTIRSVIITIYSLMVEPLKCLICDESNNTDITDNIDNTNNSIRDNKKKIIDIFLKDYQEWKFRAKEYTEEYATPKLWNITTHKLTINYIKNKNIKYLLWLGKFFGIEKKILNDIWIFYIMPHIIGKVGPNIITRYNSEYTSISDRYSNNYTYNCYNLIT